LRNTAYMLGALLVFLFALDLMISSLQHLGSGAAETIILATSNPFTGLFIGLLITAILQSSSSTTAMIVALVASGSITLQSAVPIVMGANVGTTITSTIVSLGFITKKKEFRRAVAAGTYHDFFNILTVVVLFPLEYYYGFLSGLSQYVASTFFSEGPAVIGGDFHMMGLGLGTLINSLVKAIDNGFILIMLSIGLLFGSILFFRGMLSNLLGIKSQGRLQQLFFESPAKAFGWGLITTAAIRSSTVTTSLVVPLVAKKIVKLQAAVPFILGANVGTTLTAFLASFFNSNAAISIAIAHILFNCIGVGLFFFVPVLKNIPVRLAEGLGELTLKYRLAGFLYLLLTFFFIPFSLIYFNKNSVSVRELTYERQLPGREKDYFTVICKNYENQQLSQWLVYEGSGSVDLQRMVSVYRRKNLLLISNDLFELNRPGFCRDGEDESGQYKLCIREVIPQWQVTPQVRADSVYVFEKRFRQGKTEDSTRVLYYISASSNLLLKKEKRLVATDSLLYREQLFSMEQK